MLATRFLAGRLKYRADHLLTLKIIGGKDMHMPGFTAEAALSQTRIQQHHRGRTVDQTEGAIYPAVILPPDCDPDCIRACMRTCRGGFRNSWCVQTCASRCCSLPGL